MKKPAFLNSKKFRYGSVSTTVTVMFIAFILVFNIIFSTIADRNSWYIDMTDEQVFTLSDAAKDLLDTLEQDVTVIFATDRDKIESDFGSLESGKAMAYIFNTAKLMQTYTKNKEHQVHLEFVDCERNPTYFDQFQNLSAMVASGDSFNDLAMIQASKAGFLFRSTEQIKKDYPEYPAFEEFDDLYEAIVAVL